MCTTSPLIQPLLGLGDQEIPRLNKLQWFVSLSYKNIDLGANRAINKMSYYLPTLRLLRSRNSTQLCGPTVLISQFY